MWAVQVLKVLKHTSGSSPERGRFLSALWDVKPRRKLSSALLSFTVNQTAQVSQKGGKHEHNVEPRKKDDDWKRRLGSSLDRLTELGVDFDRKTESSARRHRLCGNAHKAARERKREEKPWTAPLSGRDDVKPSTSSAATLLQKHTHTGACECVCVCVVTWATLDAGLELKLK